MCGAVMAEYVRVPCKGRAWITLQLMYLTSVPNFSRLPIIHYIDQTMILFAPSAFLNC